MNRFSGMAELGWGRTKLAALALFATTAIAFAVAPRADGFVYWSNWTVPTTDPSSIARANLDGTGADQSFISVPGGNLPTGLSVNGSHLFWANSNTAVDTLGRANLDGSSPNQSFVATANSPGGTAVNSTHIFWTQSGSNSIGRANLDGSAGNQNFIMGASTPVGIAVNATHLYWANQGTDCIGRAPINDPASADQCFIDTGIGSEPSGVAVDATHVYWSNYTPGTIGRETIDGTSTQLSWISGLDNPCDIAVHGGRLYWAEQGDDAIGRADLGGEFPANVNQEFITGADNPCGIAVDNLSVPSCQDTSVTTTYEKPMQVTLPCDAGGGTPTFTLVSQPAHGQISGFDPATGQLTYTPAAGYRGSDSFQYMDENAGAESNVATANITVGPNSNEFDIRVKRNTKKGTAKITATVPGPGGLELDGAKVKDAGATATAAGDVRLPLKAAGKAKRKLKRSGKAKVSFEVTFSPVGGDPRSESAKTKLKKRQRS